MTQHQMVDFHSTAPWSESGKQGEADTRFDPRAFADKVGLNWSVSKQPIVTQKQAQSAIDYAWGQDPDGDGESPAIETKFKHFSVERSDTGGSLGIVKGRYECLQPMQSLEWFQPWLDDGSLALHSAGVLEGGSKTWILAQVLDGDTFTEVVPGDDVVRFMLLFNSFDGSSGVLPMFSPIRMFCTNQLPMIRRTAERIMSIRHSSKMGESLDFARKVMEMAREDFQNVVAQYQILARNKTVNAAKLRHYIRTVLDIGVNKDKSMEPFTDLFTKSQNIITRVESLMDDKRQADNPHSRGSWYAAFNAVNQYMNHNQGNKEDTRLRSLWFGQNRQRNQDALKVALEMAA